MKVSLDKAQYRALNGLRGLPEGAHMLVMCSAPAATGGVVGGDEDAFEELVSFIGTEMAEGMLTATASRALRSLCLKPPERRSMTIVVVSLRVTRIGRPP